MVVRSGTIGKGYGAWLIGEVSHDVGVSAEVSRAHVKPRVCLSLSVPIEQLSATAPDCTMQHLTACCYAPLHCDNGLNL